MKRKNVSTPVRLFILALATSILVVDAAQYYKVQATQQVQTPSVTQTEPTPEPTPVIENKANSRVANFTLLRTVDQSRIESAQTSFIGGPASVSISGVSIYQLKYEIRGKDGSWKPVSAKVYVPVNAGSYPLFVFGSGTTGMADKCAPSLENMAVENLGNYDNQMIDQAAEGYVSVFPDYEGFNSADETQAYFVSDSEAKVMLGAIRSLIELQPTTPALQFADLNTVFLSGYSQGGHAALSAAKDWDKLPASVKLKGIIQYAGAADVEALFLESPWLASYLADSYAQYYGLDPRQVLQDSWIAQMNQNNEALCVNAAYRFYPHAAEKVYTPAFLDAIETHTWPENLAAWNEFINQNTPLTQLPNVPYLSIQGEVDPIVTAATQRRNVQALCQQQKNVTYREYPGVNHFQVRQESFTYSNEWMKSVLAGQTPPSSCQL